MFELLTLTWLSEPPVIDNPKPPSDLSSVTVMPVSIWFMNYTLVVEHVVNQVRKPALRSFSTLGYYCLAFFDWTFFSLCVNYDLAHLNFLLGGYKSLMISWNKCPTLGNRSEGWSRRKAARETHTQSHTETGSKVFSYSKVASLLFSLSEFCD